MRILPAVCVLLAAVVAGLLFAPVFGIPALLVPLGVPAIALLGVDTVVGQRLAAWRPWLLVLTGLLAVAEATLWSTTAWGLPTGATLDALAAGVTESWQVALQSTWPARPDAALLFVPLLVVLAGVLGLEILHRLANPLLALAPSLAVVVLSQFYSALTGWTATVAALAYAVTAGALLTVTGRGDARAFRTVTPVVVAVACAVAAGALLPAPGPRYSLKDNHQVPLAASTVASPLDEIAARLEHPDLPVFEVRGDAGADRWSLVVLDRFDGVNWTPGADYRRLGTELPPGPEVTVDVVPRSARVEPVDLGGPWLPSQPLPSGVRGAEPLVEEHQGTLLRPGSGGYTLTWWEPQIDRTALLGAAIDPAAPGGLSGVGTVPAGVSELAEQAVRGMRPSLQSALVLEQFFRDNYRVEAGQNLPTGHSWPQLADFLLTNKRGTSEQFAAAYVALARIRGIPARLAVGYRAPANRAESYTVRNGDVLAWPEVAVQGVGWVQLDPSGTGSAQSLTAGSGLAAAAAQARQQLPAPQDLRDPPVAPGPASSGGDISVAWGPVLGTLLGLLLLALLGVPLAKAVRAWRRKRRAGTDAIVGAWQEARDRLRAHGLAVSAGMTVRDLAAAAKDMSDERTQDGLQRLRATVDLALWSGESCGEQLVSQAWDAVREVRRGLAGHGWRARLRAAMEPRTLLPPG